jgi:hypothetical protein
LELLAGFQSTRSRTRNYNAGGATFRTVRETSFFLKSVTIVRLGHGESQTVEVLVSDARDGKSRMQQITVTYEDTNTYLGDFFMKLDSRT